LNIWNIGQEIPLELRLVKDGLGLSGLAPTVELRRYPDYFYWDWNTAQFVDTGGIKELTLGEVVGDDGLYQEMFDHSTVNAEGLIKAIYRLVHPLYPVFASEFHNFRSDFDAYEPRRQVVYDYDNDKLIVNAWLENKGLLVPNPDQLIVTVLKSDGTVLAGPETLNTHVNGLFKAEFVGTGVAEHRSYIVQMAMQYQSRTFTANAGFVTVGAV